MSFDPYSLALDSLPVPGDREANPLPRHLPAPITCFHDVNDEVRRHTTHRTLPVGIVIWDIHSEFKDAVLVQAMSDEDHSEPH